MTPDQIGALTAIINILDKVSGWPFGLILFLVIVGPWIAAILLAGFYQRTMDKAIKMFSGRHESVVRMYESNVELVKRQEKISEDLSGIITYNTQVMTQLVEAIKSNMYCPLVREKGPPKS